MLDEIKRLSIQFMRVKFDMLDKCIILHNLAWSLIPDVIEKTKVQGSQGSQDGECYEGGHAGLSSEASKGAFPIFIGIDMNQILHRIP